MDKLFRCLSKLCQNNTYAEMISIYFTAKMILAFSDDNNYALTINTSAELKKALYTYSLSISPLLDENHLEEWTEFCEYMNKTKLADNFRTFLSIVTPAVVSDWTPFLQVFNANDTGKILVALILILRAAPPDNLIISKDWKKQKYLTYEKDFKRIGLLIFIFLFLRLHLKGYLWRKIFLILQKRFYKRNVDIYQTVVYTKTALGFYSKGG